MAGNCPRCQYDLTGLTSGPCPECGPERSDIEGTYLARRNTETVAAFLSVFPGTAIMVISITGLLFDGLGALALILAASVGWTGLLIAISLHLISVPCGASLFSSKQINISVTYKYVALALAIDLVALIALLFMMRNTQWTT